MAARHTMLESSIPAGHVMLIYWICWVRTDRDTRWTASGVGSRIIPAKGCIGEAERLDTYGDRTGDECIPGGHGVTVLWPTGHRREVRA